MIGSKIAIVVGDARSVHVRACVNEAWRREKLLKDQSAGVW